MRLRALLLLTGLLFAASALSADIYDQAVAHAGRSAADLKRDPIDKPTEVLRLSGVKPGMTVADFMAADGYYSELLSYVVGDQGHVLLLNNKGFDDFVDNKWKERIAQHHLTNVEHRTVDTADMHLAPASLDAIFVIKVYHDLYWVDDSKGWHKIDVASVLDQLHRALKPDGVLVVEDHSAKAGSGDSAAGTLHRIDEAFAKKDFEAHGFHFVKSSDILRRPDDTRELISFKGPAFGKTDRWLYLFKNQ